MATSMHSTEYHANHVALKAARHPNFFPWDRYIDDDRILIDIKTAIDLGDMESKNSSPIFVPNPGATVNPLLLGMLVFLLVFPWLAQLLPQQLRDYIALLFR
jgi:hypothetical protein